MYLSALSLALTRPSGLSLSQLTAAIFTQYSASPQVWYDPSDLVWNWRRNLLTYSEQFDNAAWTKGVAGTGVLPVVTPNAAIAPDGTLTADQVDINRSSSGSGDSSLLQSSGVAVTAVQYTGSLHVKAVAAGDIGKQIQFRHVSGGALLTVTLTADWQRIERVETGLAGTRSMQFGFVSGGTQTGLVSFYAWGAQLDLGTTATPYQRITDGVQDYYVYGSAMPTLYQDSTGTTPVTAVGQPVGLMLDKSRGLVLGSELRSTGVIGLIGSATAATYNTSTGAGAVSRVDASNQSYVNFSGLIATGTYRVEITNTGAVSILVRQGGPTLSTALTVAAGATVTALLATGGTTLLSLTAGNTGTATFTLTSARELPGLHASQSTALSRPVLSSRYNLLTYTEQFDNAAWVKGGATITASATTPPTGLQRADKIVESAVNSTHLISTSATYAANTSYTQTWRIKAGERFRGLITLDTGTTIFGGSGVTAVFNLQAQTITGTNCTATLTALSDGWFLATLVALSTTGGTSTSNTIRIYNDGGSASYLGDGTSGFFISGADLKATNESTLPYQRVTTATDYDADFTKFPPFLSVDGTDDGMVTPSWDLTSTDKVTVVAGVRKLSDAANGGLLELSTSSTSNGVFNILAPGSGGAARFQGFSRGTSSSVPFTTSATWNAPVSAVVSNIGDISGDRATLRLNGTQVAQTTTDQGTGTYGNYPLYLFRRAGTSEPFNGRFYGLTIIAASLSANDITVLERFQAQKTGITI